MPLFDRAQPEQAVAQARLTQAEARAEAFRITVRAQIAALRAAVLERREARRSVPCRGERERRRLERIAQVSYDAGERGILELLDAYRSGVGAAYASGGAGRGRRVRPRSNWNSSADGRFQ